VTSRGWEKQRPGFSPTDYGRNTALQSHLGLLTPGIIEGQTCHLNHKYVAIIHNNDRKFIVNLYLPYMVRGIGRKSEHVVKWKKVMDSIGHAKGFKFFP
jgi:hypothetical protein